MYLYEYYDKVYIFGCETERELFLVEKLSLTKLSSSFDNVKVDEIANNKVAEADAGHVIISSFKDGSLFCIHHCIYMYVFNYLSLVAFSKKSSLKDGGMK
jgi:hypothetical protein